MKQRPSPLACLCWTLIWGSLIWLPLATPVAAAQTVGDAVATRSAEAMEHYAAGRYDEALRAYRDALVERPGSSPLHLKVGDALYELGDYDAAADEFEHVTTSEDPALAAQGFHNLGNSRFQLEDFGAAAQAYREALSRAPDDIDTKQNLELALQMLQAPPPPQGGEPQPDDQGEQDESQEKDQEQQEPQDSEQDAAADPPPDESSADEEQQQDPEQDDQESEQEQESPPSGQDEPSDEEPQDESSSQAADESADDQMDEQEAEQLLDALSDREEEGQKRRFRVAKRRDQERDW